MGRSGMKSGIFLQVRLKSKRLPGKALLELAGLTVIEHAMQALGRVAVDVHALLTDAESASALKRYAEKWQFHLFAGPSLDVLERYCRAAGHFGVTRIVRATGDNPLVSAELTRRNLEYHQQHSTDFSRFEGAPLGTGVEVVEARALFAAREKTTDPYDHEHVTPYILKHKTEFSVHEPPCPPECRLPRARVTLDTAADFKIIHAVYTALYRHKPIETVELVQWLKTHTELWQAAVPQAE